MSYADQLRIQALQEYQQRLAEPVTLNNDILVDFSSRMIAEMSMRPYKTALTIHGQTFTADEFIDWAMTQSEIATSATRSSSETNSSAAASSSPCLTAPPTPSSGPLP